MKDIDFNVPGCNETIMTGLAFYSSNYGFEQSKRWALDWIKHTIPEEFERLSSAKESQFSNRGFVCRMIKNGLRVSPEQNQKLIDFFKAIDTSIKAPEPKDETPKAKTAVPLVNQIIFQLEDVVDAILSDSEPTAVTIPADTKQIKDATSWIEKEVIETVELIGKYQAILSQLESVYERCGGIKTKLTKPKKPTGPVGHVEKTKAIKTMKYQKEDAELKVTSLSPAKLVGSKRAVLFNTKYKTVSVYTAAAGQTLTVSGSSIRGFDESLSFMKAVRKPAEFFATKNKFVAAEQLKTNRRPVRSHVSECVLIVEVA
jgi:hypothetical protein